MGDLTYQTKRKKFFCEKRKKFLQCVERFSIIEKESDRLHKTPLRKNNRLMEENRYVRENFSERSSTDQGRH